MLNYPIVAAIALLWQLLASTLASDLVRFPKFTRTLLPSGNCQAVDLGTFDSSDIFSIYCPSSAYAQIVNCSVCCVEEEGSNSNVYLAQTPQISKCGNVMVGSQMRAGEYAQEGLVTIYRNDEAYNFTDPYINFNYLGCVNSRVLINDTTPMTGSQVLGLSYRSNLETYWESDNLKIRFWDFSPGCHSRWVYTHPAGGPTGSSNWGEALYCREGSQGIADYPCSEVEISFTDTADRGMQVDDFFKPFICIRDSSIRMDNITMEFTMFGGNWSCIDACRNENAEMAYINREQCLCGNRHSVDNSVEIVRYSCDPCPDNPDMECGNYMYTSAYVLDEKIMGNLDYVYWQCVTKDELFNDPGDVLHPDLYKTFVSDLPSDCIDECKAEGFKTALIMSHRNDALMGKVECACLAYYRFRMQDLEDECMRFWCNKVHGPCVATYRVNPLHAAVYCLQGEEDCGLSLMMSNYESGICEHLGHGYRRQHFRANAGHPMNSYFECIYDPLTDLWSWDLRNCSESELFDEDSQSCYSTLEEVCEATDARGYEWVVKFDSLGEKDCFGANRTEEEEKSAFWYCDGTLGTFNSSEPDRTQCVEDWVEDTEDMINNGDSAVNITDTILTELSNSSSEPISGGGLLQLADLQEDLLSLHIDQLQNTSDISGESEHFTENTYQLVDMLMASTLSWQEVPSAGDRAAAASSLFDDVDATGTVRTQVLSQNESLVQCKAFTEAYPEGLSLIKIEQHLVDEDEEHVVFEGRDVKVLVPKVFFKETDVLLAKDSIDQGCVSIVGASYAIDHYSTQMLPESPSEKSPDDSIVEGLHTTIVDFTITNVIEYLVKSNSKMDDSKMVTIKFTHKSRSGFLPSCVFWDRGNLSWLTTGCVFDRRSSTHHETVCRCNHLTNFAIIFGHDNAWNTTMNLLSEVLGIVSAICVVLTLVISHWFRLTKTPREIVDAHRNYCLLIGQVLFVSVVGLADKITEAGCTVIAAITHYFWMATFAWILCKGVVPFLPQIKTSDNTRHITWSLYGFGYGIPIIITVVPIIVAFTADLEYIREDACWLNDGFIWAFKGPVAFVLLYSTFMLCLLIRAIIKIKGSWSAQRRNKNWKNWLKTFLLQSYLLGITWFIGYFTVMSDVVSYIFIALNTSTGIVILVSKVFFNAELKKVSGKIIRRRRTKKVITETPNTALDPINRAHDKASKQPNGGTGSTHGDKRAGSISSRSSARDSQSLRSRSSWVQSITLNESFA